MGMMKASAFKDGYRKLKIGMEKKDVIDMFGIPDSQKVRGNTEYLAGGAENLRAFSVAAA